MPTINSVKDWESALEKHWENLLNIMCLYLPMHQPAHVRPGCTESGLVGAGVSCFVDVLNCKKNKNWYRLLRYINAAWAAAPDDPSIHRIPGWGVLCDLCSEEWVFAEE